MLSLIEATKFRLCNESTKLDAIGLTVTAQILSEQMNSIGMFEREAMMGDQEHLQNAARDLSFSLAHIFIGQLIV